MPTVLRWSCDGPAIVLHLSTTLANIGPFLVPIIPRRLFLGALGSSIGPFITCLLTCRACLVSTVGICIGRLFCTVRELTCLLHQYFSSLERLRLAQDGHDSPSSTSRPSLLSPNFNLGSNSRRSSTLSLLSNGLPTTLRLREHKLRRRKHIPQTIVVNQSTEDWFASLPPAVRRRLFSPEECHQYTRTRGDIVILDAADETLRRRSWHPAKLLSEDSFASDDQTVVSPEEYKQDPEEAFDFQVEMGDYKVDDFRWLEDETELDLKLYDYHEAIVERSRRTSSIAEVRKPSRRKPSLSSISVRLGRSSTSSSRFPPESPQTPGLPIQSSTPTSPKWPMQHVRSHASLSSIDPRPAHYQDPNARLKLRLYLASPQKFDEAIEFGFPAVKQKVPQTPVRPLTSPAGRLDTNRTFFHDDTPELSGDEGDEADEPDHMYDPRTPEDPFFQMHRSTPKPSVDISASSRPFYSRRQPEAYARGSTTDREMTLHMTLTRPDLRSPEARPVEPVNINKIPLVRPELHLDGDPASIWDTLPAEESKVKRFLRKLKLKREG